MRYFAAFRRLSNLTSVDLTSSLRLRRSRLGPLQPTQRAQTGKMQLFFTFTFCLERALH